MANGLDLGSLIAGLGQLNQQQRAQTQQISGLQMEQGAIGEQIANNLFEVAERTERVELQKLEAQLEAQNQYRRIAREAGMDASASNEILSDMMAGMRNDMLVYDQASRKAQEMDANGNLLANPLGWLNNVLNGPEVQATRDAAAERIQTQQSQLNNMHALTQANVQTQNAIAETMTAATVKDTARANALLAESKALEAEQNARQYTIAGINTLREYGSVEFNRRLQVGNQLRQQQQHAATMELRQQELALRKQQMELELEGQESWEQLAGMINEYQERVGSSARPVTAGIVKQHWGQNTPVGQRIMMMADRAFLSEDTGQDIIGRDPYDSWTAVRTLGLNIPPNTDPDTVAAFEAAQQTLAQQLEEVRQFTTDQQRTDLGLSRENMDDQATLGRIFNSVVESELSQRDTRFDEYKLNTDIIKSEYPAVEQTEFYKSVVQPLETTDSGTTIKEVAAITAEKFSSGELDINEAVDGLTSMWRAQRDLFNATNGRDALGVSTNIDGQTPRLLVGERTQSVGSVGVQTGLMSFDLNRLEDLKTNEIYERIDLTDPNAAARYLIKYRSNRLAREMQRNANR